MTPSPDVSAGAPDAPVAAPTTPGRLLLRVLTAPAQRRSVALGTAGLMGHQVAEMLVPVVIGATIDRAVLPGDPRALAGWLTALGVLFVALALSWRLGLTRTTRAHLEAEHDLRQRLVGRVLDDRGGPARTPGATLSLATSDATRVAGTTWLLASQLAAVAAIVTAAVALVAVSAPLAAALAVGVPLAVWGMHRLAAPLEQRSEREQARAADTAGLAADLVAGLRVLQGLGASATAARRYRRTSRSLLDARVGAARATAWYSAGSAAASGLLVAVVALAAGWLALRGTLTVGQLVTVVGVVQTVQTPVTETGYLVVSLAQRRASAARVCAALAAPPVLPVPAAVPPADPRTLTVRVGGAEVAVGRGELVGLHADVPGARDLVEALGARVPAPRGTVLLDGVCAADLGPGLRAVVHAPPRDAHLFAGPLGRVVAGDAAPDPALLRAAVLDDVLALLPDGAASPVRAGGSDLSGGQRDRVRLARALHRDEPFLVLHEPATAVDSVTEVALAAGLRARPEKGVLLVTDSPALLAACDRVVTA
ncbi:ABC transporter ATP-binding protein/permease [Cellulomonas hominis]|uniref:ABC transporter transmembrane domain-containing protein n=1 Tax=Cellulomonas hominis TaxID=156981 RepID=UPI001C11845D|nr:ABC transporter ATP-binding protein [Cellulomonas hominis]MBU5422285.1 ABC transporter ATP-binding protein/permease [Cellulomonas hominis]